LIQTHFDVNSLTKLFYQGYEEKVINQINSIPKSTENVNFSSDDYYSLMILKTKAEIVLGRNKDALETIEKLSTPDLTLPDNLEIHILKFFINLSLNNLKTALLMKSEIETVLEKILRSSHLDLKLYKYHLGLFKFYSLFLDSKIETSIKIKKLEEIYFIYSEINFIYGLGYISYFIAIEHNNQMNYIEAIKKFHLALNSFNELKNKRWIAKCFSKLGSSHKTINEKKNALSCFHQALEIYKDLEETKNIAYSNNEIAKCHFYYGDFNSALINWHKNLKYSHDHHLTRMVSVTLTNLAVIYQIKGDLDKAKEFIIQCIKIFKNHNSILGVGVNYINLGNIYLKNKEFSKAEYYFKEALKIYTKHNDYNKIEMAYYNIINLFCETDPSLAQEWYDEMIKNISKFHNNKINILCNALILKNQERAAEKFQAIKFLQDVITEPTLDYQLKITAILNLIDLLIVELTAFQNPKVLDELNNLSSLLISIADEYFIIPLKIEGYILKSKFLMSSQNVKDAYYQIEQADKIVIEYELDYLQAAINDQKEILSQIIENWDITVKSNRYIIETLKDNKINEYLDQLSKTRISAIN
jgi:tetratricopeptide (TPR) repeat protein